LVTSFQRFLPDKSSMISCGWKASPHEQPIGSPNNSLSKRIWKKNAPQGAGMLPLPNLIKCDLAVTSVLLRGGWASPQRFAPTTALAFQKESPCESEPPAKNILVAPKDNQRPLIGVPPGVGGLRPCLFVALQRILGAWRPGDRREPTLMGW